MYNSTNTYELGRRLGQQGPRQTVGNQAALCDKLTTGHNLNRNTNALTFQTQNTKSQTNRGRKGVESVGNKKLNILQINVCGLKNKKTELALVMSKHEIHIALLQETLHKNIDTHITGYTSYPCNCTTNCRGIVTYIRNDIRGEVDTSSSKPTEIQKITLWYAANKYKIYNVYSPPGTQCDITDLNQVTYCRTVIAGDFNGHSPQWGYPDLNPTGRYIEDLCLSTNLTILQDAESQPSLLHRSHLTQSRPDLTICSTDIVNQCISQVIEDIGSDHRPIITNIDTKTAKIQSKQKTRWNFNKADWKQYQETTNQLLDNLQNNDTDTFNKKFTQIILHTASQTIPKGCRKKYRPFWNQELQSAVSERNKARSILEEKPSVQHKIEYNKASAKVKLVTKQAKKNKWQETCSKLNLYQDGNKAWKLMHNLSGERRVANPKPIKFNNVTTSSERKIAENFNRYFASVNRANKPLETDKTYLQNLKSIERAPNVNIAVFEEDFNIQELEKALRKLKPKKSPGPDNVHNEMLKHLGSSGKKTLLKLINNTWRNSKIPKAWRNAYIIPLLKKNKATDDPRSYRPLSLTSCIGKIAESMINNRLYWYLEMSNNLCTEQAGFRAGNNIQDQIFRLMQKIQDGFQKKQHTLAILVDLQQAYDRVWKKGLLMKMRNMGIHGKLYSWIKQFLTDRTIQTKLNDSISDKQVLEEGLPQGSPLSCSLFLIFINDLANILKNEKALYADDLAIWHTSENIRVSEAKLNKDLDHLQEYCKTWKLKINIQKTVYTIFTKSNKTAKTNIKLKLEQNFLQKDEQPTYLGIQLDRQLNLNKHVENLTKKATRRLQLIKRLSSTTWGADKDTLRNLYLGYVRSTLEHSNAMLVTCSKTTTSRLDKIQNGALRLISGALKTTPTAACEIHCNVEPLEIGRDKAAMTLYERQKRMEKDHPNRKLVDGWIPIQRIKQISILQHVKNIQDRYHLPEKRQQTSRVNKELPPNTQYKGPDIYVDIHNQIDKNDDPVLLSITSRKTIDTYPDDWIHIYTDGSATKATVKAGFGVLVHHPDGTSEELYGPCGEYCNNYEAEITAIETAVYHLNTMFDIIPSKKKNTVIFTDSKSALQALKNNNNKPECTQLIKDINNLINTHNIKLVMQWIPGHSNIPGNDRADTLAKRGSNQTQIHTSTSLETTKQIIKSNCKEDWLNRWAMGVTGRKLFQHMSRPNPRDNINNLKRREQSTIFRLRTGHTLLNNHISRIQPNQSPACPLCEHPHETVEHHLFYCPALHDIRITLLPQRPDTNNTLFGSTRQLSNTCRYHYIALGRRASAHKPLDP
jgi:ribonuclease HI